MKLLCAFVLLTLIALNYGLTDEEEWKQYKAKFNREYNATEEAKRFELFKSALQRTKEQNEKFSRGESSWQAGLNQFSDRTLEEKQRQYGLAAIPSAPTSA